jgi:phosphomevalonate kinase
LARATAFHRPEEFLQNTVRVKKKDKVDPEIIYNIDNSGLSSVNNLPKLLLSKAVNRWAVRHLRREESLSPSLDGLMSRAIETLRC